MNISNLSLTQMSLTRADSLSKVETAMLSKALDANEVAGADLLKMIDSAALELSVNPNVGSNFDMVV